MKLEFPVKARIDKPVSEVFEAVYNPVKMAQYFITGGGSGSLDTGRTVTWEFADHPGAFPVVVKESLKNSRILLEWEASDGKGKGAGYNTTVTFEFTEKDDGSTVVEIVESGWQETEGALAAAIGNAQGWMQFICCLKAFCEYGINLRKNFF